MFVNVRTRNYNPDTQTTNKNKTKKPHGSCKRETQTPGSCNLTQCTLEHVCISHIMSGVYVLITDFFILLPDDASKASVR